MTVLSILLDYIIIKEHVQYFGQILKKGWRHNHCSSIYFSSSLNDFLCKKKKKIRLTINDRKQKPFKIQYAMYTDAYYRFCIYAIWTYIYIDSLNSLLQCVHNWISLLLKWKKKKRKRKESLCFEQSASIVTLPIYTRLRWYSVISFLFQWFFFPL